MGLLLLFVPVRETCLATEGFALSIRAVHINTTCCNKLCRLYLNYLQGRNHICLFHFYNIYDPLPASPKGRSGFGAYLLFIFSFTLSPSPWEGRGGVVFLFYLLSCSVIFNTVLNDNNLAVLDELAVLSLCLSSSLYVIDTCYAVKDNTH